MLSTTFSIIFQDVREPRSEPGSTLPLDVTLCITLARGLGSWSSAVLRGYLTSTSEGHGGRRDSQLFCVAAICDLPELKMSRPETAGRGTFCCACALPSSSWRRIMPVILHPRTVSPRNSERAFRPKRVSSRTHIDLQSTKQQVQNRPICLDIPSADTSVGKETEASDRLCKHEFLPKRWAS